MNKIIIGLWIAMIALLLWANYSPVNAQMFPGRGDIFFINGEIKQHHETYFRANQDKIKYVILNSKGGDMQFAYNIMIMVSHLDITAMVPKNGTCQSACTVIYQAAKRRVADETATFVYHTVRFDSRFMLDWIEKCPVPNAGCRLVYDQMTRDLMRETWKMFKALKKFGMDADAVLLQLSQLTTPDPDWMQRGNLLRIGDLLYTAEESMKYNIVTEIKSTLE